MKGQKRTSNRATDGWHDPDPFTIVVGTIGALGGVAAVAAAAGQLGESRRRKRSRRVYDQLSGLLTDIEMLTHELDATHRKLEAILGSARRSANDVADRHHRAEFGGYSPEFRLPDLRRFEYLTRDAGRVCGELQHKSCRLIRKLTQAEVGFGEGPYRLLTQLRRELNALLEHRESYDEAVSRLYRAIELGRRAIRAIKDDLFGADLR
ncbi:MAG: hypothetical protein H6825_01170 [Planctomycetes bacterium]|nr:hypothetical protein [Planctomycetota bacterium]